MSVNGSNDKGLLSDLRPFSRTTVIHRTAPEASISEEKRRRVVYPPNNFSQLLQKMMKKSSS